MKTLRKVTNNLSVADLESANAVGSNYALVVDCTGKAAKTPNRVHLRPTGTTSHSWTVADLDAITEKAVPLLKEGKLVLVHCRRGISRSTCAAAAILLALGEARNVDHALSFTKYPDSTPNAESVTGLRRWWRAVQERKQTTLF